MALSKKMSGVSVMLLALTAASTPVQAQVAADSATAELEKVARALGETYTGLPYRVKLKKTLKLDYTGVIPKDLPSDVEVKQNACMPLAAVFQSGKQLKDPYGLACQKSRREAAKTGSTIVSPECSEHNTSIDLDPSRPFCEVYYFASGFTEKGCEAVTSADALSASIPAGTEWLMKPVVALGYADKPHEARHVNIAPFAPTGAASDTTAAGKKRTVPDYGRRTPNSVMGTTCYAKADNSEAFKRGSLFEVFGPGALESVDAAPEVTQMMPKFVSPDSAAKLMQVPKAGGTVKSDSANKATKVNRATKAK